MNDLTASTMLTRLWQCLGGFLSTTTPYPSVPKSNRVHVCILWISFIKSGIYSTNSSKTIGNYFSCSLGLTSTGYFSNSTSSSVTNCWFSPIIGLWMRGDCVQRRYSTAFHWGVYILGTLLLLIMIISW